MIPVWPWRSARNPRRRRTSAPPTSRRTCLKLFDRVRDEGVEYVVTKHGKPVARIVPAGVSPTSLHGAFAGRIRITGDIVSMDWHDEWEAAIANP